jgi:membrane-associated phospholipid phosphatase
VALSRPTRARIAEFDHRVDTALHRVRSTGRLDRIFYAASSLGDFSLIWLLLGALRGLRSEHDWHAAVRVGGALGLESVLVNVGIKSVFRRTRPPWQVDHPLRIRRPKTSSFPSGHATSSFCAATLLSDDDVLWPLYYAVAGLVSTSRVYVRVHHASDVIVGATLGLVLGRLIRRLTPLPVHPLTEVGESGGDGGALNPA